MELYRKRKEARTLAIADKGISEEDEATIVNISISFHGTCSKKGHNANDGICFVICAMIYKVLYCELISKVCNIWV